MTKQAGIYSFDGRPPARGDWNRATSGLSGGRAVHGSGLLAAWAETTTAAGATRQGDPSTLPQSLCTFDGRIHNRRKPAACERCEAELALKAYESRGVAGFAELIGDWSLVLWDARRRIIILAADYAGNRPLYYCRTPDRIAWSSSLNRLACWMECRELDDDYAAEFLVGGFPRTVTPYRGILSVPPGSAVIVSQDRTVIESFWRPAPGRSVLFRDEHEYEEQFRVLFREAVAVRLPDDAPVAAELSGGLDSSSIVSMADRLISSGESNATAIISFSYDLDGSPDRSYVEIVERDCPTVVPIHLDAAAFPMLSERSAGLSLPVMAETRIAEVGRRMRAMSVDLLLTGQFGDLITGNLWDDSGQAADHLAKGRVTAAVKEAFAWSREIRRPVYPILWQAFRSLFPAWDRQSSSGTVAVSRSTRDRARRRDWSWVRKASPSRRKTLRAMDDLMASRFFQSPEALDCAYSSHPFTHRPLVEFLLAIPPSILCRPGEPRRLMRRALRGILPPSILRRGSKGNYEKLFVDSLRACASGLVQAGGDLRLARRGYVDGVEAMGHLRSFSGGQPGEEVGLRNLLRLELWLRQRIAAGSIADDRKAARSDRAFKESDLVKTT